MSKFPWPSHIGFTSPVYRPGNPMTLLCDVIGDVHVDYAAKVTGERVTCEECCARAALALATPRDYG